MNPPTPRLVSVERVIPADAPAIFAVLTDPTRHADIDGSGALVVTATGGGGDPVLGPGSVFVTPMTRRPRGRHPTDLVQAAVAISRRGRMRNTVVEFVPDRRIAWRNFGGHLWRYELEPLPDTGRGTATLVRESFDYATNLAPRLLELAGFPTRNRRAMATTLGRLERAVTDPRLPP